MKTVYADVVFGINFMADYVLLYISACSIHIKVNHLRIIAAAAVGGLYAVFASVAPFGHFVMLLLGIALTAVICFTAFYGVTAKAFARLVINMYVYSFILCGIVSLEPFRYICGTAAIAVACVLLLFAVKRMGLYRLRDRGKSSVTLFIRKGNAEKHFVLLCDSGNLLTDPVSLLPIIILSSGSLQDFVTDDSRCVAFRTAGGVGTLRIAETDELSVLVNNKKIRIQAVVGECQNDCTFSGFDGIIPRTVTENIC